MTEKLYVGYMGGVWSAHGYAAEFRTLDALERHFRRIFQKRGMNVEFREAAWSERPLR